MGILRILLIVVEVATSLLLIGVILLQKTKSEGLGLAFGSGMGETLFGSRAGNVLTKITVTLAMVFLANTTILGVLFTNAHETSIMDQRLSTAPMAAPAGQPLAPTPMAAPQTAPTLMPAEMPVEATVAPTAEVPVEQPQP
jgi:preprotein translocase subunit SecG